MSAVTNNGMENNIGKDTNLIKVKSRISILISYFDNNLVLLKSKEGVHTVAVKLSYEVFTQELTEDILDEAEYGSADKREYYLTTKASLSSCSEIISIDPDKEGSYGNKITSALMKTIIKGVENYSLVLESASLTDRITIDSSFFEKVMTNHKNVLIDLSYANIWINLSTGSYNLQSFTLKNANVELDNILITVDKSITIENVLFSSSSLRSSCRLNAKESVEMLSSKIATKGMFFSITTSGSQTPKEYEKSFITINDIQILYEDIEKSIQNEKSGRYTQAIIGCSGSYKVSINNIVTVKDIPYYLLLYVSQCANVSISKVSRAINTVPANNYSIKISDLLSCNIDGLEYHLTEKGTSNDDIAFILPVKSRIDSNINITNCNLEGMQLANFIGLKANKVVVESCTVKNCGNLMKLSLHEIGKLSISSLEYSGESFSLESTRMSIRDSTITCDEDISLSSSVKYTVTNSTFKSKKITLDAKVSSDNTYTDTSFSCDEFLLTSSELPIVEMDEENAKVSFVNGGFSVTKELNMENMGRISFTNSQFLYIPKTKIAKKESNSLVVNGDISVKYANSYRNIYLENIDSLSSTLHLIDTQEAGGVIDINGCEGILSLDVGVNTEKKNSESVFTVNSVDNILDLNVDMLYVENIANSCRFNITSSNCVGSRYMSDSKAALIVMDLSSKDMGVIRKISEDETDSSSVLYKNV